MTQAIAEDEIYAEPVAGTARALPTNAAALMSIPVSIAVSVGRARATIEELLAVGPNTILTLDSKIDDPVELFVGDRVIARGRLVELADGTGVGVEVIELIDSPGRS